MTSGGKINTTRILRQIWLNRGVSRVQISRRLGLNKSTVSKIAANLEEIGIIETDAVGKASRQGGRRPIHLRINASWGCVMGVEIQTEAFTVVGSDLHGDLFFSHTELLDIRKTDLVTAFVDIVRRFQPYLEANGMRLIGIGVGLSGFVDPARGVLISSMPLNLFEPIEFTKRASRALSNNVPILVDNDANCGCWGELAFRHSERPENFLFVLGEFRKHSVNLDDYRILALGFGLVINGRVYHGSTFSAGEFRSILFKSEQINQFSVTDDQARRFLQDPEVDSLIAEELAIHVAFIVTTLNIEKVVIGGPIEMLAQSLTHRIRERLDENWAYPDPIQCEFSVSKLGEQAVAFGAAGMFLEHMFTVPVPSLERPMAPHGVDLVFARLQST